MSSHLRHLSVSEDWNGAQWFGAVVVPIVVFAMGSFVLYMVFCRPDQTLRHLDDRRNSMPPQSGHEVKPIDMTLHKLKFPRFSAMLGRPTSFIGVGNTSRMSNRSQGPRMKFSIWDGSFLRMRPTSANNNESNFESNAEPQIARFADSMVEDEERRVSNVSGLWAKEDQNPSNLDEENYEPTGPRVQQTTLPRLLKRVSF